MLAQVIWFTGIGFALILTGKLPDQVDVWVFTGGALLALGLGLMAWSSIVLGRNLTAVPEPVPGGEMVSSGPYGLVRHPIYTAVISTFLGISIALGSWTAAALSAGLVGFFLMKSRYEERQLRMAYSSYDRYADSVRHRFIPGVI